MNQYQVGKAALIFFILCGITSKLYLKNFARYSILLNRRLSAKRLVKETKDNFGATVDRQTVRNRLNEVGSHDRIVWKQSQMKRLQWAKVRKLYVNSY